LASLGFPVPSSSDQHPSLASRATSNSSIPIRSVILEAELVPYNEGTRDGRRGPGIEEFWWLDAAGSVADDAPGARSVNLWARALTRRFNSGQPRDPNRHLCVVYFDILHLDGANLLTTPYSRRRALLESTVRPIVGFALLSERTPIPLQTGRASALSLLRAAFAQSNARREEGLVLKSAESTYNGTATHRWVKLKKDYIPDLGDCVDLVLLGAGWDIDRARELRVDTSVFTTWYLGVLTNGDRVRKRLESPHFDVVSRVSYGSSRDELELWNSNIRMGRWGTKPYDKNDPLNRVRSCATVEPTSRLIALQRSLGLSYTPHFPQSMIRPSVVFEQPMCAEVMGAGFQKLPFSEVRLRIIIDA
jgi:DNA ligase-4